MKIRPPSVRARLTLWYAGVLTLIICIFSAGILHFVDERLYAALDTQLDRQIATIGKVYREEPDELKDLAPNWGITFFQVDEGGSIRHQTEAWEREGLARALQTGDPASPLSWTAPNGHRYRVQSVSGSPYGFRSITQMTSSGASRQCSTTRYRVCKMRSNGCADSRPMRRTSFAPR
jgi:hypothetical protein